MPADATGPSRNPLPENDLSVIVTVPQRVDVQMVDARSLGDYELWFAITTFLSSTFFSLLFIWIPLIGEAAKVDQERLARAIVLLLGFMFAISVLTTFLKRRVLFKGKRVELTSTAVRASTTAEDVA